MNSLGCHILVEFSGCEASVLDDVSKIEALMIEAAEKAGATVIQSTFHHFSPIGVSGVVVIQESHLAIHTWPEYGYAAVDLFTCGDTVEPWISFDHLKKSFKATNHSAIEMYRGSLNLLKRSDVATFAEKGRKGALTPLNQRTLWFTEKDDSQALSLRYTKDILFNERSSFQTVRVFETASYGKMLTLDGAIMCTERDEFHYHEMLVHPAAQSHACPKHALVIGGGDGGSVRELLRYPSIEKITLVEIDEVVVRASKQFFPTLSAGLSSPRVEIRIENGLEFVKKAASDHYDLVIVDGADPVGPAAAFFGEEFYRDCLRIMRQGAVLSAQGESPMFHEKAFISLHRNFRKVFSFENIALSLFHASTYPSGMWSVHFATKGGKNPNSEQNWASIKKFCEHHALKYYNEDVHRACFSLPTFVRKMISL